MRANISRKKAKRRPHPSRKSKAKAARKWSDSVTQESDALDLKGGVFTLRDPKKIAASLKCSAEQSKRRKAKPYRSALSMLILYINRGGKYLSEGRKPVLEQSKVELWRQIGRA